MRAGGRRDFGGGHVLALPSERVANPVHEVVEPALVPAHQTAGTKPCVAVDEHVAQNLSFGGGPVRIAFEAAGGIRSVAEYLTNRLASFVGRTADAKTFFVAYRLFLIEIELHQRHRHAMLEERRYPSDRNDPAFAVVKREVAFGCSI